MKTILVLLSALLSIARPARAFAGPRDTNHVVNPGFEDHADGHARGWSRYGEGYERVREGRAGGWCIRLANLRDGLEDYEYLAALGRRRGDPWSARADCEPVTTSLTAFTHDPAVLMATRERVARELSAGAGGSSGTMGSREDASPIAAKATADPEAPPFYPRTEPTAGRTRHP